MPMLMPSVQIIATALSSRTVRRRLSQSMPSPLPNANSVAPNNGEKPKKAPMPTPPSEAWAMPPPAMTNRRVTT